MVAIARVAATYASVVCHWLHRVAGRRFDEFIVQGVSGACLVVDIRAPFNKPLQYGSLGTRESPQWHFDQFIRFSMAHTNTRTDNDVSRRL